MSWFNLNVNESLNNIKGQITNVSNAVHEVFTDEVSEGTSQKKENQFQEYDVLIGLEAANTKIDELNKLCNTKDNEVSSFIFYPKYVDDMTFNFLSNSM